MKNGRLIQDLRTIELTNLVAKHGGAPCIAGDMVDQNVAPSVGDASLVIEGEGLTRKRPLCFSGVYSSWSTFFAPREQAGVQAVHVRKFTLSRPLNGFLE
jgi:hypothetical protein